MCHDIEFGGQDTSCHPFTFDKRPMNDIGLIRGVCKDDDVTNLRGKIEVIGEKCIGEYCQFQGFDIKFYKKKA